MDKREEAYSRLYEATKRYTPKDFAPFRRNDNIRGLNALSKWLYVRGGFK